MNTQVPVSATQFPIAADPTKFNSGQIKSTKRALRGVAIGRRNYLFVGAAIYSLIGTAKLNGTAPKPGQAVFRDFARRRAKPTTPRPSAISA